MTERLTYYSMRGSENDGWYLKPGVAWEEAREKLAMYEDIGTVSEFRELKEKATAKKVKRIYEYGMFDCPHCNKVLPVGKKYPHCTWCGGLIDYDWSEGKE